MPSFQPPNDAATARFLQFLGLDTRTPFGAVAQQQIQPASLEAEMPAAMPGSSGPSLPDLSGIIKTMAGGGGGQPAAPPPPPPPGGGGGGGGGGITWTDQFGRPIAPGMAGWAPGMNGFR